MGLSHSPGIIPDGLVFYFDPINPRSYAGTGLTGYNLIDTSIVGSFVGGAVYDVANKGSIYFDGSDDRISFSFNSALDISQSITIEAYIKPQSYPTAGGGGMIVTKVASYYLEFGSNGKIRVYFEGLNSPGYHESVNTVPLNKWTHVSATRDSSSSTINIYINGILDKTVSGITGNIIVQQTWYLTMGGYNGGGYLYIGLIGYGKIYNRALSSTEILQNYNATKKRFSPEENIVLDGLILEFDAGNSSSYSGIGNTGYTIAGAGVTASLINGTSFSTLNGGSFVFDGSNDHIILNDFYLTQTNSSNEYTIMASGKLATISTGVRQLISSDSGGYDWSFGAAGTGYFIFTGAGSTSASTQDLNWHIFAAQWSSAGSRLYLDNSLLINTTVAYDANINQTFIGKNPTVGFGEYWNGNVGTVLIYNRILTTQELTQNYNALKGRYGLS